MLSTAEEGDSLRAPQSESHGRKSFSLWALHGIRVIFKWIWLQKKLSFHFKRRETGLDGEWTANVGPSSSGDSLYIGRGGGSWGLSRRGELEKMGGGQWMERGGNGKGRGCNNTARPSHLCPSENLEALTGLQPSADTILSLKKKGEKLWCAPASIQPPSGLFSRHTRNSSSLSVAGSCSPFSPSHYHPRKNWTGNRDLFIWIFTWI